MTAPKKKKQARKTAAVVGFSDVRFKLSVVSALMDDGHYVKELDKVAAAAVDAEDYQPIAEVLDHVAALVIPPARLAKIKSLQPDGGDLIYQVATTLWDGEDDIFDISSIEGIESLVNLEVFAPIAMIDSKGLDYTPLLGCKNLVRVDFEFAASGAKQQKVRKALAARGVDVGSD